MKTRVIIFLLFLTLEKRCTGRSYRRIVHGQLSKIHEYPYVVSLLRVYGKIAIPSCGGTIISSNKVLTAAHCLRCDESQDAKIDNLYVNWGSSNLLKGQVSPVTLGMCHPNWNFDKRLNDIGIIQVAGRFEGIRPVMIGNHRDTLHRGTYCAIVGWGEHDPKNFKARDPLSQNFCQDYCPQYNARVSIITLEKCIEETEKYGTEVAYDGSQLCAYKDNTDACYGDSGGPLLCNHHQYGIISFGIGCALKDIPGIYTSVPYYHDWIVETMHLLGRTGHHDELFSFR